MGQFFEPLYLMLDEAYKLKVAVNKITDMWDMKLHQYEIEGHKWEFVQQLHDLLKVRVYLFQDFYCALWCIQNKSQNSKSGKM